MHLYLDPGSTPPFGLDPRAHGRTDRLPPLPPTSKTRVLVDLSFVLFTMDTFGLGRESSWARFWRPWAHLGHILEGFGVMWASLG